MRRGILLAVILLGMALPLGCGPGPQVPASPDLVGTALTPGGTAPPMEGVPTSSPVVVEAQPTATLPMQAEVTPQATSPAPAYPTPAALPFDALFGTPMTTPQVSPWRPPTYPIPWAPTPFDHFLLGRPIPAFYGALPLDDYRYGGVYFGNEVHTGIDIPADPGTVVLAAGTGRVMWAGEGLYFGSHWRKNDPYGLAVLIRHDFGWDGKPIYTVYAHMSKVLVQRGDWVARGTPIGLVGSTGHATGPHLHFEVRVGLEEGLSTYSSTRNPELWMVPPIGWGILVGRVRDTWHRNLAHYKVYLVWDDGRTRKVWRTYTYGQGPLGPDPYYQENYTFGDLPAGRYTIKITYNYRTYAQEVTIAPGQVTFFTFTGSEGFEVGLPPLPEADWQP